MIIRLYNDDSSDYVDLEADTAKEIRDMAKNRIALPTWQNGWSEVIEDAK